MAHRPSSPRPSPRRAAQVKGPAGNPFATNPVWYVNPAFQAEIDSSIATCTPANGCSAATLANLQRMRDVPSAYWLDTMAKLRGKNDTRTLEGILADASTCVAAAKGLSRWGWRPGSLGLRGSFTQALTRRLPAQQVAGAAGHGHCVRPAQPR